MKTLADFEDEIDAAVEAGQINTLIGIDATIRRIAWSPTARPKAHSLAAHAFEEAKRLSDEPYMLQRTPRFPSFVDGAGKVHDAIQ